MPGRCDIFCSKPVLALLWALGVYVVATMYVSSHHLQRVTSGPLQIVGDFAPNTIRRVSRVVTVVPECQEWVNQHGNFTHLDLPLYSQRCTRTISSTYKCIYDKWRTSSDKTGLRYVLFSGDQNGLGNNLNGLLVALQMAVIMDRILMVNASTVIAVYDPPEGIEWLPGAVQNVFGVPSSRKTEIKLSNLQKCMTAYGDIKKHFQSNHIIDWPNSWLDGAWDYIMLNPNYRAAFPFFATPKANQQAELYGWILSNQNSVHRNLVDSVLGKLSISTQDCPTTIAIGTRTYIENGPRHPAYYPKAKQTEYMNKILKMVQMLMREGGLNRTTTLLYHATDSPVYRAMFRDNLKGLGRHVSHDVPSRAPVPGHVNTSTLLSVNNGMVDFAVVACAKYAIISCSTFYHAARIPTAFDPAKKTIFFSFLRGAERGTFLEKFPRTPYNGCSKRDKLTCNFPVNWSPDNYAYLRKLGLYDV